MCIISIDVGIKNLAICIAEKKNNETESNASNYTDDSDTPQTEFNILYWNVINLIKEPELFKCGTLIKNGKRKGKSCDKTATVKENVLYYCSMHNPYKKDKDITKELTIKKTKTYVKNIPTQKLSVLLFEALDTLPIDILNNAKEVLIEQQPSFNPKMKMMSNMIYSHFIRIGVMNKYSNIKFVKFISPKNKLKVYKGPIVECNLKTKYSRTKKLGIEYCRYIIQNDNINLDLFNNHNKKDDLADSALMAFWYLSGLNKRIKKDPNTPKKKWIPRKKWYKKKNIK